MRPARSGFRVLLAAALAGLALAAAAPARADSAQDAQQMVDKARLALQDVGEDPNMQPFRDHIQKARAVLILPQMLRAAFLIGASGGSGVVLARDEAAGQWGGPAFYTLGQASFGFQAGADAAEVIILAMTERGLNSFLKTSAKLGADASAAVGPVGAGGSAATANLSADLLAFSKSKGLYGGFSVDGGVLGVRESLNHAYYGKPVNPKDILVDRSAKNPQADELLAAVKKLGGGK
jgi:lipid-binding SYLF domain-containing protein